MSDIIEAIVCRINVGDMEDPDIFVAEPIINWQNTESGKFIMEKCIEPPVWNRNFTYDYYGYVYSITAKLKRTDYIYWKLKYE